MSRRRSRRRGRRYRTRDWSVLLVASLLVLLSLYYCEYGIPSSIWFVASEGYEVLESVQATNQDEHERAILAAVNRERSAQGVYPLEWDAQLQAIARAHSQDMAEHSYMGHVNKAGQHPGQRAVAAGYHCGNQRWEWGIGENLYFGGRSAQSAESAVNWWMNSPLHRVAMLSPTFRKAASGVHKGHLPEYGWGTFATLLMC